MLWNNHKKQDNSSENDTSRGVGAFLALLAQLALLVVNEGAAAEFYYKKS